MEKYIKAIEKLNRYFGREWIKPAMDAVVEIAVQDFFLGGITQDEFHNLCEIATKTKHGPGPSNLIPSLLLDYDCS